MSTATVEPKDRVVETGKDHQKEMGVRVSLKKLEANQYQVIVATEDLDRHGEKLQLAGLETANYLKNPVVLVNHNYGDYPIAKSVALEVKSGKLIATVELNEAHPDYLLLKKSLDNGFINTASIGFIAYAYDFEDDNTLIWTESEMIEFSFVTVPANPEAQVLRQLGFNKEEIKQLQAKHWLRKPAKKEIDQDEETDTTVKPDDTTTKEDDKPAPPDTTAAEDREDDGKDHSKPDEPSGDVGDVSTTTTPQTDPPKAESTTDPEGLAEEQAEEQRALADKVELISKEVKDLIKELTESGYADTTGLKELSSSLENAIVAMQKSQTTSETKTTKVVLASTKGHAQVVHRIAQQIIVECKSLSESEGE